LTDNGNRHHIEPLPLNHRALSRQTLKCDAEIEMKIHGLFLVIVAAVLLLGFGAAYGQEQSSQPTIALPPDLARILTDYEKASDVEPQIGRAHV